MFARCPCCLVALDLHSPSLWSSCCAIIRRDKNTTHTKINLDTRCIHTLLISTHTYTRTAIMLHHCRTTTTFLLRCRAAATATATLRPAGSQHYHRLAAAARLPSLTHTHTRKHLPATTIATQQQQHRTIFNSLQKPPTGEVEKTQEEEEAYALAHPIDFDVASRIEGAETQIAVIDLEPGQILRAETGMCICVYVGRARL